jgi:hypothetical protein
MADMNEETKPKYSSPTVVLLGALARGLGDCSSGPSAHQGDCETGPAADECSNGSAENN